MTQKSGRETKGKHCTPAGIREVAELCGVSTMTVSRALNNPEKLSHATLEKVHEAIRITGYVPNLTAGSLRFAKTRLIALIVPHYWEHFTEVIQVITDNFNKAGYQVMLGQTGYSLETEAELIRASIGRRPDGIIITGAQHSLEIRNVLRKSNIPVVEIWDLIDDPIEMIVGFKHEEVSSEVCRYLQRIGRKNIVVISATDPRALRRNDAFLRTASDLGLPKPFIRQLPFPINHAAGRVVLSELLEEGISIDAISCCNDYVAMGIITEAKNRGISIPDDIAVIGWGDSDFAQTSIPSLTSVKIDATLVGERACEMILARIANQKIEEKISHVGFSIISRQSA